MADSEVKDLTVNGSKVKVKKEKPVLVLPEDITDTSDVALLEEGNTLGLGVPTDNDINNYFRTPGTLAIERKKKYCDDTAKDGGYKA